MILIQGGLVKTITGGDIENGQVLIDGGKTSQSGRTLIFRRERRSMTRPAAWLRRASLTRIVISAWTKKRAAGRATIRRVFKPCDAGDARD